MNSQSPKRLSRKQRAREPRSFADNESLACVASPMGPIRAPIVSDVMKEIVLDRLDKEVIAKCSFSLSSPRANNKEGPKYLVGGKLVGDDEREKKRRKLEKANNGTKLQPEMKQSPDPERRAVVKKRLVVGTNQCTTALEAAASNKGPAPLLLMLARDIYPPTILAHAPFLAKQVGTPILLLPGRASMELGKVLGTKKVAILAFLPATALETDTAEIKKYHNEIDSFIDFAKTKLPP